VILVGRSKRLKGSAVGESGGYSRRGTSQLCRVTHPAEWYTQNADQPE